MRLLFCRQLILCLVRSGPVPCAQTLFENFSRGGFGQVLDELHKSWAFVVSDARTAELDEFRLSEVRTRLDYHQCSRHFSPFVIRDRNDRGLIDGRMRKDGLLDLER